MGVLCEQLRGGMWRGWRTQGRRHEGEMKAGGKEKEKGKTEWWGGEVVLACCLQRASIPMATQTELIKMQQGNVPHHPALSSSCTLHPFPFLSIFTLCSPNTHSPSFLPHQPDKKTHKLTLSLGVWTSCSSCHPCVHLTLLLRKCDPRDSWMISFLLCKQHCVHRDSEVALKETTSVFVCLHHGVTNCLFCSNNNISQWFSTSIWLISMPTSAWHPQNFLRLAENYMRHHYALLG